ncbi:hypothetical protein BJ742DRAFT_836284 [Cladochytrium replicatum]|nr:hypothetical protein BJ742DRAFT_836284 [Cladochytrium replicatum]
MFSPGFVAVTKNTDATWQRMKPDIYASIMDFFASGNPVAKELEGSAERHDDTA